jgi:hypothetical protein
MDHTLIVADMTSGDIQRIRTASCAIIYAGQNRDELKPLIPFIDRMQAATQSLNMGGMFSPNKRFPEYAIKTLAFHRDSTACTCNLYAGGYDSFDPDQESKAGNIEILSTSDDNYHLVVRCKKCDQPYDITEQNGHWIFYEWKKRAH